MPNTLYLIRGLPGSGKTTKARELLAAAAEDFRVASHFEADDFFTSPAGVYTYDPALSGEAHSWCRTLAGEAMAAGEGDVIVANTFVRLADMEPYRQLAARAGYAVEVIVCRGSWPSVHNVPAEVIERMSRNWEELP